MRQAAPQRGQDAARRADGRDKGITMNDSDLQASVAAELDWDLKIDGNDIAVFADGGVVTLRGTVTSSAQKHLAHTAARRVDGVSGIRNQLLVRVLDSGSRADAGF